MTRKRNDDHSTEFGLWLRQQLPNQCTDVSCIDSSLGYITTNIDYKWENYNTGKFVFIEEKRFGRKAIFPQTKQFKDLHTLVLESPHNGKYKGFFYIVFENTNPDDGRILIKSCLKKEYTEINPDELLTFLRDVVK